MRTIGIVDADGHVTESSEQLARWQSRFGGKSVWSEP
jgi:hypothetical protein